jgi:hypothetical protein
VPLLRVLHEQRAGAAVLSMPSEGVLSKKLKVYLERARVKRSEL